MLCDVRFEFARNLMVKLRVEHIVHVNEVSGQTQLAEMFIY